jgi:xylulose-5-phosphate/fructose-6-phosphate phosphoketolase
VDAARDGAVLPILHLNGYKINNPTLLGRLPHDELVNLFCGYGYDPHFVEGQEPQTMHQQMAATLDTVIEKIAAIQSQARSLNDFRRPSWPMIVLRTPKGWTGPKTVDGKQVEGTYRAHQVPIPDVKGDPRNVKQLEEWMKSYRSEELFDEEGRLKRELAELAPKENGGWAGNRMATAGCSSRIGASRLHQLCGRSFDARWGDGGSDARHG